VCWIVLLPTMPTQQINSVFLIALMDCMLKIPPEPVKQHVFSTQTTRQINVLKYAHKIPITLPIIMYVYWIVQIITIEIYPQGSVCQLVLLFHCYLPIIVRILVLRSVQYQRTILLITSQKNVYYTAFLTLLSLHLLMPLLDRVFWIAHLLRIPMLTLFLEFVSLLVLMLLTTNLLLPMNVSHIAQIFLC
jgi:hypothetical protein